MSGRRRRGVAPADHPPDDYAAPPPQEPHRPTEGQDFTGPDGEPLRIVNGRPVPVYSPPGFQPALFTAGLAVVLAGTALTGSAPVTALGVAMLQVVTAAGVFRLNGMWPARQGIILAVLGGFAADAALLADGGGSLRFLPGVLFGVFALCVVQQLIRRDGRPELTSGLTVTASAALLTVLAGIHLPTAALENAKSDAGAVTALAAAAVAVAVLLVNLPLPPVAAAVLALAAAAGVGAGLGPALGLGAAGALLGAGAGAMGLLGRRVAGYDHPSRFVHLTAGVALPLTMAAPAAYLLGRVVLG